MPDSIIILAGGDNSRWNGERKYLKEVNGEQVLGRTIRLCKEFRPDADIHVIGPEVKGTSHQDVFLKVFHLWSEDGYTYFMFGDVSWMRGTLRAFLNEKPGHILVYGRPHGNELTGRPAKELFGAAFPQTERFRMAAINYNAWKLLSHSDWWTAAELMIYPIRRQEWIFLLPKRLREFVWFHLMRDRKAFLHSKYFHDVWESVTDDFDYPEDYLPYVEHCSRFLENEVAP